MPQTRQWIERLQLRPHPEGGYYRETYRSGESISRAHLPARFSGDRAFSTAIYYLLEGEDFSTLHVIKSDEIFHFYDGLSLTVHVIDPDGTHSAIRLGRSIAAGEVPQAVIRAGQIFGARLDDPASFALVGCTVAPGFDFADFECPQRAELLARFPQHRSIIERLMRV